MMATSSSSTRIVPTLAMETTTATASLEARVRPPGPGGTSAVIIECHSVHECVYRPLIHQPFYTCQNVYCIIVATVIPRFKATLQICDTGDIFP